MRWEIEWTEEAGSTNDAAVGRGEGCVIVARRQTSGRGQRGNAWSSEPGANLTFSVVLAPVSLPAAEQFLLSEAVSLAVVDALAIFGIDAAVKWPNDIYVGDRKIAGILIENDIRGAALGRSVIGIGLNVNQSAFPPHLPNPVSLRQITDTKLDLREVLNAVLDALSVRYTALQQGYNPIDDYNAKLYRRGTPAPFALPDGTKIRGTIESVLPSGELIITLPDKTTRQFLFKEIEFI